MSPSRHPYTTHEHGEIVAYWITMILMIVITIVLLIMTVYIIIKFYFQQPSSKRSLQNQRQNSKKNGIKSNSKIKPIFKATFLISIIFAIASIIADFVHVERGYTLKKYLHRKTFKGVRAVADGSMFVSLFFFNLHLFARIIKVFNNTPWQISKKFTYSMIFIMVIITIFDIIYVTLVVTYWNEDTDIHYVNEFLEKDIFHGHIWGVLILHALFVMLITGKFSLKLREMMGYFLSLGRTPSEKLMILITKNTILSSVASMLLFLRLLYRQVLEYKNENTLPEIVWMISYGLRDIVLLSTIFAMYFSFSFNTSQYKFVCSKCDKSCHKMCRKTIKNGAAKSQRKITLKLEMATRTSSAATRSEAGFGLSVPSLQKERISVTLKGDKILDHPRDRFDSNRLSHLSVMSKTFTGSFNGNISSTPKSISISMDPDELNLTEEDERDIDCDDDGPIMVNHAITDFIPPQTPQPLQISMDVDENYKE